MSSFRSSGRTRSTGTDRYTFGQLELLDGINIVILLVGLYALPPVIDLLETPLKTDGGDSSKLGTEPIWTACRAWGGYWKTWLRSVAHRHLDRHPARRRRVDGGLHVLQRGAPRLPARPKPGARASPRASPPPRSANNADTAAALIPALTLGIPGTAVAAVMLGGLLIHGLQPGPMLFRDNPDIVFGFMWQFLFGAILLVLLGGSLATNSFARLLNLPRPLLGSVIIVLMLIGVYSIHGRMFDVYLMLGLRRDRLGHGQAEVPAAARRAGPDPRRLRRGEPAPGPAYRPRRPDGPVPERTSLILVPLTVAVIVGPLIKRRLVKRKEEQAGS